MRDGPGAIGAEKEARAHAKPLVVEDNGDNRRILVLPLQHMDAFDIHEATTGHEWLAYLKQELPDLTFLALTLPDLDGW